MYGSCKAAFCSSCVLYFQFYSCMCRHFILLPHLNVIWVQMPECRGRLSRSSYLYKDLLNMHGPRRDASSPRMDSGILNRVLNMMTQENLDVVQVP